VKILQIFLIVFTIRSLVSRKFKLHFKNKTFIHYTFITLFYIVKIIKPTVYYTQILNLLKFIILKKKKKNNLFILQKNLIKTLFKK